MDCLRKSVWKEEGKVDKRQ